MPELALEEDSVRKLSQELNEPDWLQQIRVDSHKRFLEMEKPKFKYGLSLYMPIRGAKLEEVNPFEALEEEIEVENPGPSEVMTISEALQDDEYSDVVKKYFMQKAYYPGQNKVTAMHGAFWSKGLLIHVPEGEGDDREIKINMNMREPHSLTHVLVVAEPNSTVHIVEKTESEELDYGLKSHGVEVFVGEGAHVTYESLQNLDDKVWHFNTKRAVVDKEGEMNWFTGTFGAKHSKVEVSADLSGQGSQTSNLGVFMGTGFQKFDTYNTAVHSAPNTDSDMDNKGIVMDRSKSVYRGLVKIKEKAKNCNGYQKEDTLILSDNAEADAVPNLEIENNDVRCSHGATIGQVDDEELFYMMTRGLTRKQAEREIVKGFLGAMINRVTSQELKERMDELVLERMS